MGHPNTSPAMARALKPPANLPSLVQTTFAKARAAGDLHYFPTQVTLLPVHSVPVRLPVFINPSTPNGLAFPSRQHPRTNTILMKVSTPLLTSAGQQAKTTTPRYSIAKTNI